MVAGSAKIAQQADSPPAPEHQSFSSVCPVPPGIFSPACGLIANRVARGNRQNLMPRKPAAATFIVL